MKYAVEIGAMVYIRTFTKIGSYIQTLTEGKGGFIDTAR
jgi:hypothetical protein